MIDYSILQRMKDGATLINTSRGAIVNQDDLQKALIERPDITAILDVLEFEPPDPASPLLTLENVHITPHIAGSMGFELGRMGRMMVEEISNYTSGRSLKHLVTQPMLSRIA